MTPPDLVRILETIPTQELAIINLAWELVGEDGQLDVDRCVEHAEELQLATEQVDNYIKETSVLVRDVREWLRQQ